MTSGDLLNTALVAGIAAVGLLLVITPKSNIRAPSEPTATSVKVENPAISHEPQLTRAAMLGRRNDGHFWAEADVDGTAVKFLVDTGASTVALTYRDAQRLGLNPDTLDYVWTISTAGGETKGASVLLSSIRVGKVEVKNVEAMVLQGTELKQSLLGMTFLGELYSYEFRRDALVIRQ